MIVALPGHTHWSFAKINHFPSAPTHVVLVTVLEDEVQNISCDSKLYFI